MCLVFISINQHPNYKLIVAANRDEFYNRKTAPADYWADNPAILGGRDLEANGTWMAINKRGNISMVTNYRDPKNINPQAPSRGQLVTDFLTTDYEPLSYLQGIEKKGTQYNGFNLVVGSSDQLFYYSNYRNGVDKLNDGLYGLSNHLMDTPWPKVTRGKEKFSAILDGPDFSTNQLLGFLQDDLRAPDDLLPQTGISLERERALSSMFIKTTGYGTRCSTIILIDRQNQVQFTERVYDLQTFEFTDRTYQFAIESQ
jgi:uncharacterized protein with NRDE domain